MRGCFNGAVVLLAMLVSSATFAAPPTIDLPQQVVPSGDYATLVPKTDAVSVSYVGLSGVDAFPSEFLKDPRSFILPVRGLAKGDYKFAAVAASKDGEQVRKDFVVRVGGAPTDPVIPKDPVEPVDPVEPSSYYFALVRPDGPSSPEFTKIVANPSWKTIEAKGHKVKDFTITRARELGIVTGSTPPLPCVAILKEANKKSKVLKIMSPIPDDPTKLLEEIK